MRDAAKEIFESLNTEADVQTFISGQVENLYVDFKIKQDLSTKDVDPNLQKVLSKAISGFANADGGVIILGIDAPQNGSPSFKVIAPYSLFEQEVNSYISRATSPVVQEVQVKSIPIAQHNGGVVLIYVPKSDQAPHRSMKDKEYYQRIGDSFIPMEHYQIADMFGRRHQPRIIPIGYLAGDINTPGEIIITLAIENDGKAIGRFLLFKINDASGFNASRFAAGGNYDFCLKPFPSPTSLKHYQGGADDFIHPGTELLINKFNRHYPRISSTPIPDVTLKGVLAAQHLPAKKWELTIPSQNIYNILGNPGCPSVRIVGTIL